MADPDRPLHFTDYATRLAAYAVIIDDQRRILLSWFNGSTPGWTLPGGGVEFDESIEDAVVREVKEETGYDIVLGWPLATHSFSGEASVHTGGPFKSVRVVYDATIVGGELGTLEVGGTTDFAEWVPLARLTTEAHADIVAVAISAHTLRRAEAQPDR